MRPMMAVLALFCPVLLLAACSDNPSPTLAALRGSWSNEDPNTRGLDSVRVEVQGSTVQVHVWGACVPMSCDWGTAPADASAWGTQGVLHVTWDQGFAIETQTWSLPSANRLSVITLTHFTDNSGRADIQETDYFARH